MNSYTSTDCYCSVISIAFGFEFDFEFALEALAVVGKKAMHHYQEHKAFVRSTC
jgi:hypothetical protein